MASSPTRYYAFSILTYGRRIRLAVWNGIKDYENLPPDNLLGMTGKIGVIQVNKAWPREQIEAAANPFDNVIIWTKNQEVYTAFVNRFKAESDVIAECDLP